MQRAFNFAKKAHTSQTRRSGEPYIMHPLAVASLLAEMQLDARTLSAAFLHDVIEDCNVSGSILEKEFGGVVTFLVRNLSKLKPAIGTEKSEYRRHNLHRLLKAMSKDRRVVLIKLADRLHNISTIHHLLPASQRRIARETLDIYAQLARRMGLYDLYRKLADQSFATLYPVRYRVVKNRMAQCAERAAEADTKMRERLTEVFEKAGMEVEFRPLEYSLYSFYTRWRNGQSLTSMMQGARRLLLVNNEEDCYRALGKIHATFKARPGFIRDLLSMPKSNGYRSLHTQVSVAGNWSLLVIRSRKMDAISRQAVVSRHEKPAGYENLAGDLERIAKSNSPHLPEDVRDELMVRRISAFTPNGKRIHLPEGATALDFAFALSSEIGLSATGCQLENRRMPLTTPLQNGSTVYIECDEQNQLHPFWMHGATTRQARDTIRQALAARHDSESRQLGETMLRDNLQQLHQHIDEITANPNFADLLAQLKVADLDELLHQVGTGRRLAAPLAAFLADTEQETSPTCNTISGAEGTPVRFATCCYPLPGDSILGEIKRGQGFVVHRRRCERMQHRKTADTPPLPLEWAEQTEGLFHSVVVLHTDGRMGLLAALTAAIKRQGLNIISLDAQSVAFSIHMDLETPDKKSLVRILRRMRTIPGVREAQRQLGLRQATRRQQGVRRP